MKKFLILVAMAAALSACSGTGSKTESAAPAADMQTQAPADSGAQQ